MTADSPAITQTIVPMTAIQRQEQVTDHHDDSLSCVRGEPIYVSTWSARVMDYSFLRTSHCCPAQRERCGSGDRWPTGASRSPSPTGRRPACQGELSPLVHSKSA